MGYFLMRRALQFTSVADTQRLRFLGPSLPRAERGRAPAADQSSGRHRRRNEGDSDRALGRLLGPGGRRLAFIAVGNPGGGTRLELARLETLVVGDRLDQSVA